jgi:hypothetical protein
MRSLILPLERAIAKFNTYAIAHPNSGKGDRNLKPHNIAHPTSGKGDRKPQTHNIAHPTSGKGDRNLKLIVSLILILERAIASSISSLLVPICKVFRKQERFP